MAKHFKQTAKKTRRLIYIVLIILIIIDLVMYYPFFKVYEKQLVAQESE